MENRKDQIAGRLLVEAEKALERTKRDKNLLEKVNIHLEKENKELLTKVGYLKRRERTLSAIERSIPQRIETYKKQNSEAALIVVKELEWWYDMLMDEKKVVESDDEE